MRKLVVGLAVVFGCVFAAPLLACEDCAEYFDYQSEEWCPYCETVNCGFFNCDIRQYGSVDYCTGDDSGCFTLNRGCPIERTWQEVRGPRLSETWRLASVRIVTPQTARAAGKG